MVLDKIYLGGTEIQKAYLGGTQLFGGSPVSNLIINSTFDDATNLSFQDWRWTVANGVITFNDSGRADLTFTLNEEIISGNSYTFNFEILTGTARLDVGGLGNTNFSVGNNSITFVHSGPNSTSFKITGDNGSLGTAFDLDNVELILS